MKYERVLHTFRMGKLKKKRARRTIIIKAKTWKKWNALTYTVAVKLMDEWWESKCSFLMVHSTFTKIIFQNSKLFKRKKKSRTSIWGKDGFEIIIKKSEINVFSIGFEWWICNLFINYRFSSHPSCIFSVLYLDFYECVCVCAMPISYQMLSWRFSFYLTPTYSQDIMFQIGWNTAFCWSVCTTNDHNTKYTLITYTIAIRIILLRGVGGCWFLTQRTTELYSDLRPINEWEMMKSLNPWEFMSNVSFILTLNLFVFFCVSLFLRFSV